MEFLKQLAKLTRIEHGVLYTIAVFMGIIIAGKIPDAPVLLLALLIPLFSEMGAFALNDYFDIAADRANKQLDRPLVSGKIKPSFALWFSAACIILSIILAYFISLPIFLLTLLLNILAVAYNAKLKELPLVGNFYIAFTIGIPFLFGNLVVAQTLLIPNIILFVLGLVAGLGREIIKSIEDMEGDKQARKAKTLPLVIGEKPSLAIAVLLFLLFIPLAWLPFFYGLRGNIISYIFVAAGVLCILANIYYALKYNYKNARTLSLIAFFFGLIGYLLSTAFIPLGL
ncbi:MAG: UbiA family prenyltransferase [Candidatus Micrarchaeota archaeon]